MANTATVYVRIDPELKRDVDAILGEMHITPSALIQMLYGQIKLTNSIPFEIKGPSKQICIDDMTKEQLDAELTKGLNDIQEGKTYSDDEVDEKLKKEFGI